MARSKSWGFPRWGGYGSETRPESRRICDREGCTAPGDYPAPKSKHTQDKWWFCQDHAAEYNRSWNYFEGMSYDEMRRAAEEEQTGAGYASSAAYAYAAPAMSREERQAYVTLDLESSATLDDIKTQYRKLAKRYHPDANAGDRAAAEKFHEVRQAYEILLRKQDTARRA